MDMCLAIIKVGCCKACQWLLERNDEASMVKISPALPVVAAEVAEAVQKPMALRGPTEKLVELTEWVRSWRMVVEVVSI